MMSEKELWDEFDAQREAHPDLPVLVIDNETDDVLVVTKVFFDTQRLPDGAIMVVVENY